MTTRFHEMDDAQRAEWLRWANSHDWALGTFPPHFSTDEQGVTVLAAACDVWDGSKWGTENVAASTPQQLRDWAGY